MKNIERRAFAIEGLKVERRAESKPTIVGHAAVFNQLSEDLGGFYEMVAPGAFAEAIANDDVRALFNHDSNFILGRKQAGTLRLSEDARGLAIEIDVPANVTIADLVLGPIERGDITQMSFAFAVRPGGQEWGEDNQRRYIRQLRKVRLFDVSPVVWPAYPQTDVAVGEMRSFVAGIAPKTPFNLLRAKEMLART